MPKTSFVPRLPWDRAPLSPVEAAAYDFVRKKFAATGRVPGKRALMKEFGCTEMWAYGCLKKLVYKGWLGEGGHAHAALYINDKPEDLDD
jgi:hypothetical protein